MTEEERDRLRSRSIVGLFVSGLVLVVLAVGLGLLGFAAGLGLRWVAEALEVGSETFHQSIVILATALPGLLGLKLVWDGCAHMRRQRSLFAEDREHGIVEELDVVASRVWEYDGGGSGGPHYFFELDGEVLHLGGPWQLAIARVHEVAEPGDSPEPRRTWPRLQFSLTRAPKSGRVLRVEPRGEGVTPERTLGRRELTLPLGGQSARYSCGLDGIQEACRRSSRGG